MTVDIDYSLLAEQNASTSNAIITHFSENASFQKLSKTEGDQILKRDEEDATKLQAGIDLAKEKGVIDPNFKPEPYISIDVLGKTPDGVASEILSTISSESSSDGEAAAGGKVIVIVGLSGTGKGTTVSKLSDILGKDGLSVVCWSNGNIFRSVTLLAVEWTKQQETYDASTEIDLEPALTKENIASFMSMLSFEKNEGKWDTQIVGCGLDTCVSEIQNTVLKGPDVAKNIPTVAKVTQGEVIVYASAAIEKMVSSDKNIVVLLEGREQTVNYVRSPFRFNLTLSDSTLIGKRRAAQRIMAAALAEAEDSSSSESIKEILESELEKML